MAQAWMGFKSAAGRLNLTVEQVAALADAGELTKRELDMRPYGRFSTRREVKIEDVLRVERLLAIVGYRDLFKRNAAARQVLGGNP